MQAEIKQLVQGKYVTAEEVLGLRRRIFGDDVVDRAEMAALIRLACAAPQGDKSWGYFITEAMTDFFVHQQSPQGYLTEDDAAFLIATLTAGGPLTQTVLDGVAGMIAEANQAPQRLIDFALVCLKDHVLTDGKIEDAEIEMIRTFLFAAAGDDALAISRAEADLLFDLNDASRNEDNSPVWIDLFVKAIANHLMAHLGYAPLSREAALKREAWVEDTGSNVGDFFRRMVSGGFKAMKSAYSAQGDQSGDDYAALNAERATAAKVAAKITDDEARWLADRIGKDGEFCDAERALLGYLRTLQADVSLPKPLADLL